MQRDIDAATKTRERLSAQIVEFEQAITRHAAAAKQAALTGDDADLDRAEAALRAAQDRSATLKAALSEVDEQLAGLERNKAEMLDRKVRTETAAEIELLARKLTEVGAVFNSTTARLSEHTRHAVPIVYDALGLDNFMAICRADVPATLELVSKLLRAHADAVLDGRAPAKLPRPDKASAPAAAQPPKEPHFKYQPIKAMAQ
ncbi:hypothetical protein [Bradyrhizobium iriomotense]|uniref:hypothetical protein n=1 Tax=Bradyrhizobium iriomotense TaxID=441950 RepID=UPI0024E13736|nr:hypothetical protein [Bradyrhizobium iriomotense]